MATTSSDWRSIRSLRASPPGLAAEKGRRRRDVFQSALQQAEELWEAARVVGYASRPLPLFYSLSQAGRAICAAWLERDGAWIPKAHGLAATDPPRGEPLRLAVSMTDDRLGAFEMLAAAIDSPTFEGAATLSSLWASLPEFPNTDRMIGESLRYGVLTASPGLGGFSVDATTGNTTNYVNVLTPTHAQLDLILSNDDSLELLADYPTVGAVATSGWSSVGGPILTFPDEQGNLRPLDEVGEPKKGSRAIFLLRPRLGEGSNPPPSQLLTLWALLFGLSQLARYQPQEWTKALDVDRSDIAVDLEHGLDVALRKVPELLSDVLPFGGPRRSGDLMQSLLEREDHLP